MLHKEFKSFKLCKENQAPDTIHKNQYFLSILYYILVYYIINIMLYYYILSILPYALIALKYNSHSPEKYIKKTWKQRCQQLGPL